MLRSDVEHLDFGLDGEIELRWPGVGRSTEESAWHGLMGCLGMDGAEVVTACLFIVVFLSTTGRYFVRSVFKEHSGRGYVYRDPLSIIHMWCFP